MYEAKIIRIALEEISKSNIVLSFINDSPCETIAASTKLSAKVFGKSNSDDIIRSSCRSIISDINTKLQDRYKINYNKIYGYVNISSEIVKDICVITISLTHNYYTITEHEFFGSSAQMPTGQPIGLTTIDTSKEVETDDELEHVIVECLNVNASKKPWWKFW